MKKFTTDDYLAITRKLGEEPGIPGDLVGDGHRRILVAPLVAGSPLFALRDGLIAHALRLWGCEVAVLLCDDALTACSARTVQDGAHDCGGCYQVGRKYYDHLGLPQVSVSANVSDAARERFGKLAAELAADEIYSYEFEGIPVGSLVYSSSGRHFLAAEVDPADPRHEPVVRRYLYSCLLMVEASYKVLKEWKPDKLFTSHGIYIMWGALFHVAQKLRIPVDVMGGSYRRNTVRVYHEEPLVPFSRVAWDREKGRKLSPAQEEIVNRMIPTRKTQEDQEIPIHADHFDHVPGLAAWIEPRRRPNTKVFGLFTNIAWDSSLYARDNPFGTMFQWVEETVRRFGQRPEHLLVIKSHPAELRGAQVTPENQRVGTFLRETFPTLPDNVFVLPPESTVSPYALYPNLDWGLVHISTVTLEMALERIPLLSAGAEGLYTGLGLTVDPSDRDDYFRLLDRCMDGSLQFEPDLETARRYFYFRFQRECTPFEPIDTAGWNLAAINIDQLADLAPGKMPGVDRICDGLIHDRSFLVED